MYGIYDFSKYSREVDEFKLCKVDELKLCETKLHSVLKIRY